ncbi:Crp/Fnr family transcriptional regulator [Rhodopseudomonas pseudopalustris]|uniref:Cyclic nucleotide-binding n=2 Tax=Rhodopseudomonas TaxID=1073 RepID=Q137J4_RHOPS|nr:Crp/Fnr family transcriptional regulator [Rhodopseudomonas pseudopalustris]ABE39745.1 cyclic nucleotide-binding [Rhodopseudomonas palustris BisB5]SEP21807.1 cAMP-binding domain of CRP or a regulatory subunit of cAMP-dependent protein kinases [Rhodopseudomonas pseudopalustris]
MLARDAAYEVVSTRGWLSLTPAAFRGAVLERCQLQEFGAGVPVYVIGDEAGGLYGLVKGALGIAIAPRENGPYTGHLAMPGSWFGQISAFTRQPRRVGLTTTRPTVLLHLPLHGLDEIVRCDPAAWRLFGLITIEHLDLSMGSSNDLMIRDHFKRFVAVLLRLGDCRVADPPSGQAIEIDIVHEEIAYMANVARTTAGAILRKLEAEGHLALSYRRVSILAPAALRKMLQN